MTRQDRKDFWGSIGGMAFGVLVFGWGVFSFLMAPHRPDHIAPAYYMVGIFCGITGLYCLYAAARLFFAVRR